jgi:hypothetical protein
LEQASPGADLVPKLELGKQGPGTKLGNQNVQSKSSAGTVAKKASQKPAARSEEKVSGTFFYTPFQDVCDKQRCNSAQFESSEHDGKDLDIL